MAAAHSHAVARSVKSTKRNTEATKARKAASARLEARITEAQQELFRRAAELQNRSLTDFVVSVVQEAAQKVVEQAGLLKLSVDDQEKFAAALLSPPAPNAALKRAFARRHQLLTSE